MRFLHYSVPFLALLLIMLLCHSVHSAGVKDRRLAAISVPELKKAISQFPLDAPAHQELLSRARHAHLLDVAYRQYTLVWQQQPNNAYANLLRGVSAEYLQSDSMMPELRKYYGQYVQGDLFQVADSCLEKAVTLAPKSSVVNMEAGFFFWQFGNKMPKGLTLLKKSLGLAPNDPRIHAMWGNVNANPGGGAYDLQKAIQQLNLSVRLDPSYAFPHDLLANIYSRLSQPKKAQQEKYKYENLLP